MTKGKRLIKSSFVRTAELFLKVLIAFFMMLFIIHSLGERMYGLWTLIGVFVGYYELLDLGLSSAVGRYVSRALGQRNTKEMNYIVNTSFMLFAFAGIIVIVITLITAAVSPFFISNKGEATLFKYAVIILGLSMAIEFPMRVFEGILTSHLRYDLNTYANMLKIIIGNLFIYYFLKNGYGILALALISLFSSIPANILRVVFSKIAFPQLRFRLSFVRRKHLGLLFGYSGTVFLIQIADVLKSRVDSFIIAGFLNLKLVTYYAVGQRILSFFSQLIQSITGIMGPVFSQYEGQGNFNLIRKRFLNATRISVILSVTVGGSIIFYGKVFIFRWMGPEFIISYYVILIICGLSIAALMQHPSVGVLYGISKHRYYALSNTGEGLLNLGLSILLVRYYGIYGVALGTAIAALVFKVFIQPVYTCRVINLSLYEYYFDTQIGRAHV